MRLFEKSAHPAAAAFQELGQLLNREQFAEAKDLAGLLIRRFEADGTVIQHVVDYFGQAGQDEQLVQALSAERALVLSSVSLTAQLMRLSGLARWRTEFAPELDERLQGRQSTVHFSNAEYLKFYRDLHPELRFSLLRMKYGAWPECQTAVDLFRIAEQRNEACRVDARTMDFLFERNRHQHLGKDEWQKQLRTAQLIDHFISDQSDLAVLSTLQEMESGQSELSRLVLEDLLSLMDHDESRRIFDEVLALAPALLCSFHGSFLRLMQGAYKTLMVDQYTVAKNKRSMKSEGGGGIIDTASNRQTVAFVAIKALLQKKTVLIVADGPNSADIDVSVLGAPNKISAGPAFIAYESRCKTIWYTVVRSETGFRPVFELGPIKEPGEPDKQFTARWKAFYEGRLEAHFTGHPSGIVLRHPWSDVWKLAAMA
ncbi:MAG: hypothetical protein JWQ90_4959 [Hydrocarboniphaga sp.]|uniref:hypothetical protein n=1 Tax=Hydrocarboniphaga sp. TaxID=2033016 RepID=UPI00262BADB9|nr:hypothetical protein [Hydrocarboniphaga sp.]MDB5972509.1 hypothetical protein [Hydrocarboniphaga sp.]